MHRRQRDYEGSKEFEAQIGVRVDSSGNPPDVAIFPQPGLLSQIVDDQGAVKPLHGGHRGVCARSTSPQDWLNYGIVNDILFGCPEQRRLQVAGLVLAEDLRGEGLHGPDHLGRAAGPDRQDRGHRRRSRGASASAPVRPPAGRSPTGWRSTSFGPPVRMSTTSGSATTSSSTTRRSPTRWPQVGELAQEPEVRQRRFR